MAQYKSELTDNFEFNDHIFITEDVAMKGLFLDASTDQRLYRYRFYDRFHNERCLTLGSADLLDISDARTLARHLGRKILLEELNENPTITPKKLPQEVLRISRKSDTPDVSLSAAETHEVTAKEDANLNFANEFDGPTRSHPFQNFKDQSLKRGSEILTFGEFVMQRYVPHAKITKRGFATEWSMLQNHILPAFSHRPIIEITKGEVIELIHSKLSTLKPSTTNRIINGLKVVFSRALEWEVPGLEKDPMKGIKQFSNSSRHERYLTQEEATKLLNAVLQSSNKLLAPIVSALLLTGCRKREILDARWEHVDLLRGTLTVPISKSGKPRQVVLSDTVKTIFLDTKALLIKEMGREAVEKCPWVFPNPETGKPFTAIYNAWNSARQSVGLNDLRMHDLRHSFASALVNKGNSLYDVQKLLGHSSSRMTERYSHLSAQRLSSVATEVSEHYQVPNVPKS